MDRQRTPKGWLFPAFLLLCLCLELVAFGSPVLAQEHVLYEIDRSWKEERTLFEFTLSDEVPEYEVKTSGQRVDVILFQTETAETLDRLEAGGELVRTLVADQGGKTIVSLVLRRPPGDVEHSTSEENPVLRLRLSWSEDESRPAIAEQLSGRPSLARGGASMTRRVSSPYTANWKEFFRDYELPLRIEPELVYTLAPFPGLLRSRDLQAIPEQVTSLAQEGKWEEAGSTLDQTDSGNASQGEGLARGIVQADLLLRQDKVEQAREVLRDLPESGKQDQAAALSYLRAYAAAAAGDPYLGLSGARDLELPDEAPERWKASARLLEIETALGAGQAERAYALASDPPQEEGPLERIFALRRAQAGFALGKRNRAAQELSNFSRSFLAGHPRALAQLARSSYESGDYGKALQYFSRLSRALADPELIAMAEFGEAMSDLRRGARLLARQELARIAEETGHSRAKWRAETELADMALLEEEGRKARDIAASYHDIALRAQSREIREEAAFKRILVAHLSDHPRVAAEWLGSFLRDYSAGELRSHAQALLVKILPGVVKNLMEQDAYVQAMGLVQEHRQILRYASLPLDFLYDLGGAFYRLGFFERASRVYEYMLSLAENPAEQEPIYPHLVRSYMEQKKYSTAIDHAEEYVREYSQGAHSRTMHYLLAKALRESDRIERAADLLRSPDRPVSRKLDSLAGKIFFSRERFGEAERYLARATGKAWDQAPSELLLLRAESLFHTEEYGQALALYSHLEKEGYQGALARYRMGQIHRKAGRVGQGAKLWQHIVDTKESPLWSELASEALSLNALQERNN